jgi:phosphoribosylformylglycinamidine (FGAM) synthase-like amidotransferase family enzyme
MKNTALEMFATKVMSLNISPEEMRLFVEWFAEAKELEKHQISMAHLEGAMKMHHKEYQSGDLYYKETYEL